ncbi:MAG TPA: hypothetical protein VH679_09085 [Vicinamibacterales bacterium]
MNADKGSAFTPMTWERVLWSARPWPRRGGAVYVLTDLRFVAREGNEEESFPIDEIVELDECLPTVFERVSQRRSVMLMRRADVGPPLLLAHLSRRQILALVQQLVGRQEIELTIDPALVEEAVRSAAPVPVKPIAAAVAAAFAVAIVAAQIKGAEPPITYPDHDAIYPRGVKRDTATIVRFMERDVMSWARQALGPVVGGADRVTCATCHGADGEARRWAMPGVSELPYPKVRAGSFGAPELYAWLSPDPQLRNAVYADLAQDDRQATAAYMRQVVMPGMARLLGRPAYDFASSYGANRAQFAFGCYHCHRVR